MSDTARLEQALGYHFGDRALLELALTHRSAGGRNNERLEFLGDSILNHVIAEALYLRFPKAREGQLSRMRASLVKGETLAAVSRELELGQYLQLGSGERKSGGNRRASILADTLEALIGAILLEAGVDQCRNCVNALFATRLDQLSEQDLRKDAKTRLQEYLQGRGKPLPAYELRDVTGEAHKQTFRVACTLELPAMTVEGTGNSRRKAEQIAAAAALEELASHER
jgi:ribonuclease-3